MSCEKQSGGCSYPSCHCDTPLCRANVDKGNPERPTDYHDSEDEEYRGTFWEIVVVLIIATYLTVRFGA